jgi:preprotein translocase subunit SecE
VARDRKSSQRRRANAQPARARPKPTSGRPTPGRPADAVPPLPGDAVTPLPGEQLDPTLASPVDDGLLVDATVDQLDDESVNASLEGADLPVGAVPTDPPLLPPVGLTDDEPAEDDAPGEFATARARRSADRLDESDEILPAARRGGRPPAKVGGNRVTAFLRASWAELQRVQWPDRRQVGQATAVVLGFVVVAGGFLGLADLLSSDLVNAIL